MKNLLFILGIIASFIICEISVRPFINFQKPIVDNNSLIIKKNLFLKQKERLRNNFEDYTFFIGSSTFARGIDCTVSVHFNCINLALDGGDSLSYIKTYELYFKDIHPKRIVFELTDIVFSEHDYSEFAIDSYLLGPIDHGREFFKKGFDINFKQSLKNEIDSYLLWSGLNYLSRRNRLANWPEYFENKLTRTSKEFSQSKMTTLNLLEENQTFFHPNHAKLENFITFIKNIARKGTEVVIVATPTAIDGSLDPPVLLTSVIFKRFIQMNKEKQIIFISDLTHKGLRPDYFSDELHHLNPDKGEEFLKVIIDQIKQRED